MITPNGNYYCDYCKGRTGEFNTDTGNHSDCEELAALQAENEKLREISKRAISYFRRNTTNFQYEKMADFINQLAEVLE